MKSAIAAGIGAFVGAAARLLKMRVVTSYTLREARKATPTTLMLMH